MQEFSFSVDNEICEEGISFALKSFFRDSLPVVICVGTDASIGDSLGPMVGSLLLERNLDLFVYGNLLSPITAKEISQVKEFAKNAHPYSKVLIVDAAVGKSEDIGVIKIIDDGLKPGLGVNKNLPHIGDCSIIGIMCAKQGGLKSLFEFGRIGKVYKMALVIADGIEKFLISQQKQAN